MSKSKRQFPKATIFAVAFPKEAAEWVKAVGRPDVTANDVMCGSEYRVLWRCSNCSNEWETVVYKRSYGHGCLKCAYETREAKIYTSSFAEDAPHLVKEFICFTEETKHTLDTISVHSRLMAKWCCVFCNEEYIMEVRNRARRAKCVKCGESSSDKVKNVIKHRLDWEKHKDDIIEKYTSGISSADLALEHGVNDWAILKFLNSKGVKSRDAALARRVYPLDETAFHQINEESAYWIGFLMADGCVRGNRIEIGLQLRDIEHLEKFREFIKSPGRPIKEFVALGFKQESQCAKIEFKSQIVAEQLYKYGVTERKTHSAKAQNGIDEEPAFWRGFIDGDGSIGTNSSSPYCPPVISLGSASMCLLEQFAGFCANEIDFAPRIIQRKSKPGESDFWEVRLGGEHARTLLQVIYSNPSIYLDRKKARADIGLSYVSRNERFALKQSGH